MKYIYTLFLVTCHITNITITKNIPDISQLFPSEQIIPIQNHNRHTLQMINQWIDNTTYTNAFYWYGLPECVRHLIDKPIGDEITYSDALIYLLQFLDQNIRYLEIGTSFGKNFIQIAHALSNSTLVGFDLEEMSPALESFVTDKHIINTWETIPESFKKNRSSLIHTMQKTNNNRIIYISGDAFDEQAWQQLAGMKFNAIFSDAYHYPHALKQEYAMLTKYDLIDHNEFICMWDDLGGEMTVAFMEIFEQLKVIYGSSLHGFVLPLRGWLGINEYKHNIGFIINTKRLPMCLQKTEH